MYAFEDPSVDDQEINSRYREVYPENNKVCEKRSINPEYQPFWEETESSLDRADEGTTFSSLPQLS